MFKILYKQSHTNQVGSTQQGLVMLFQHQRRVTVTHLKIQALLTLELKFKTLHLKDMSIEPLWTP